MTVHTYFVDGQATAILHAFGHVLWVAVILPAFLGGFH